MKEQQWQTDTLVKTGFMVGQVDLWGNVAYTKTEKYRPLQSLTIGLMKLDLTRKELSEQRKEA